MNISSYQLPANATPLDRATLAVMKLWHGSLRDFTRAGAITALTVSTVLGAFLVAAPGGSLSSVATVLTAIGFPAGWIAYRMRRPFDGFHVNRSARAWGIGLGLLGGLVFGPILVLGIRGVSMLVITLSNIWSGLALVPVAIAVAAGWFAADRRRRRYEDPIYP